MANHQLTECARGNHLVGNIANIEVRGADWDAAVLRFEAVIEDFNVRGQRDQINHPGWCAPYSFCTACGARLFGVRRLYDAYRPGALASSAPPGP